MSNHTFYFFESFQLAMAAEINDVTTDPISMKTLCFMHIFSHCEIKVRNAQKLNFIKTKLDKLYLIPKQLKGTFSANNKDALQLEALKICLNVLCLKK